MLADTRHHRRRTTRGDSARRSTASRTDDDPRRRPTTAPTRTCSSTSSGLIEQACGEDVAGRLHTARSRNDIDMTMYRMRQREFILALYEGDAGAARRRCWTSPNAPRDGLRGPHAHAAGAADDHRALPAGRDRAARARRARGCAAAYETTNRNPLGACAITGTGFPIDRERTSELLGLRRPDRQHLRQHRDGGLPARKRVGDVSRADRPRPRRAGPAALVHDGVRLPALRRRVRAGQQHHAAEAQPGGARARARDRQQGGRPGAGDRHRRPQHAVRRHRRHRGRPAAARGVDVPRCDPRVRGWSRRRCRRRSSMSSGSRRARAKAGRRSTELADTLVRDHGLPFRTAHAIAAMLLKARHENPERRLSAVLGRGVVQAIWAAAALHRSEDLQRIMSPRHFVRGAHARLAGRRRRRPARALAASRGAAGRRSRVAGRHAATRLAAAERRRRRARGGPVSRRRLDDAPSARDGPHASFVVEVAGAARALAVQRATFSRLTACARSTGSSSSPT